MSPYFSFFLGKGIVLHHDLLVPSGSGSGSGACFPTVLFFLFSGKGFCSIMISWLLLVPAQVRRLVSLPFLSFLFSAKGSCSIMISWFLLVPAQVPGLVSLLFSSFLSQARDRVPS